MGQNKDRHQKERPYQKGREAEGKKRRGQEEREGRQEEKETHCSKSNPESHLHKLAYAIATTTVGVPICNSRQRAWRADVVTQ